MILSGEKLKDLEFKNLMREMIEAGSSSRDDGVHCLMPSLSERRAFPDIKRAFPDTRIQRQHTYVKIDPNPEEGQFGQAGFDLRVGSFIAWSDVVMGNVTEKDLTEMDHKILEPGEEFIFTPDDDGNNVYYITSFERASLSPDLEIMVDSKSTTGRVGCMSHGAGTTSMGNMITILQPYAFPLKVTCGKTRLSQVVVRFKGTPYMSKEEIVESEELRFDGEGVNIDWDLGPRGLQMRFDTHLAYRAKKCDIPIDMDAKNTLDWKDYFELIEGNSQLVPDKKTLYLLGSLGTVGLGAICGLLSREQEVMTGTGAWGHFAGVFQPFFRGGITMEFYSHSKRRIRKGDKAGVVVFDKLDGVVERPESYGGSYQDQRPPRLPKMFKTE